MKVATSIRRYNASDIIKSNEVRPLFKYTGGKYDEYKYFRHLIPETINDYFEPFAGSAGVMFQLYNENRIKGNAYISDISTELIGFYDICSCASHSIFIKKLARINDGWLGMKEIAETYIDKDYVNFIYDDIFNDKWPEINYLSRYALYALIIHNDKFKNFSKLCYFTRDYDITEKVIECLKDKIQRFKNKARKGEITKESFPISNCKEQLITAMLQAFYFIVRDTYNVCRAETKKVDPNYRNIVATNTCFYPVYSACWYFIREFCYGSMFRFSKDDKFNVPYGGASYNSKDLTSKIEVLKSQDFWDRMKTSNFYVCDFEDLIGDQEYSEEDFIFIDPPYDSTFKDYDNRNFDKEDQIRLKNVLEKISDKCKWMVVVRSTPFIEELYKDFNITRFDKNYSFHARGTYDEKQSVHMIITNYKI